jgi:diaminohydroxyphosphoribosylaminopyrimidine deaminase / 5-amino-6-(5-phosphoribosylamino)uracil reductase
LSDDARWMAAAITLASRGVGRTWPNPNVGCIIVADGRVVGRGWTQPGGRPHAEALALEQAGDSALGATLYTTLEPCAHTSERGPTCSDLIVQSGVSRVVVALADPDSRTNGKGAARLRAAGIYVIEGIDPVAAGRAMAGFLTRQRYGRPHVTLKLALSLDGCIAMGSGESQWITGPEARAHGHLERSRAGAILVGRGTYDADAPRLDVRLPGLEARSPKRYVLSTSATQKAGWEMIDSPKAVATLPTDHLLIEGGAQTAAAFLREDLVDRLLVYRAPILIGGGKPALRDIGLTSLASAHGRWHRFDTRMLGADRLDIYDRVRD